MIAILEVFSTPLVFISFNLRGWDTAFFLLLDCLYGVLWEKLCLICLPNKISLWMCKHNILCSPLKGNWLLLFFCSVLLKAFLVKLLVSIFFHEWTTDIPINKSLFTKENPRDSPKMGGMQLDYLATINRQVLWTEGLQYLLVLSFPPFSIWKRFCTFSLSPPPIS